MRGSSSDFQLSYPDLQLRLPDVLQQQAHSPVAVMRAAALVWQLGKPGGESCGGGPGDLRDTFSPGFLQRAVQLRKRFPETFGDLRSTG